jgi:hypothetical protein
MMLISTLILAVIAALFVTPIVLHLQRQKRRRLAVQRAGAELGLRFSPRGDAKQLGELATGYLFSQGSSKTILNVMHGQSDDLEVRVFDYGYFTGGEEGRSQDLQTVICFRSSELDLPAFCLRPKSVFHQIAKLFGYQDIVIDGRSHFSKNYLVRGRDEDRVRELFGDEVLAYYERSTSLFAEGNGTQLLFYRWGQQVEPDQLRFFVQEGFEVLSLFWQTSSRRREKLPDDLRQRFGVRVAGDVTTAPNRNPTGICKARE